jgi:D-amino-acid dehydrogenase
MVEKKADGFETAGAKVISLMASGDRLPVQQVVIAAGSWSGQLSTQLGSPVPLESQRGYHTEFANPGFQLTRTVMSAERKFMATSMEGGLRIAGTVEFNGLAAAADWRRAAALEREAARMFGSPLPGQTSRWMGHRPCTPDSMPVIGRSPIFRDVLFAFGHGHLGLTGAAHTGQLIAELAVEGKASIDIEPFRINRFNN